MQVSQVLPHQTRSSILLSLWTFMDLALFTGAQSCWNRKGTSRNSFHKVGSMKLSKTSWYAAAFRVPFTGTKGPSPAPEIQPHTIIPPPPTLHLAQCSQTSTVLLATGKPRLVYQIARWRSVIRHSREHIPAALESSGFTPLNPTLCIELGDVWLECSLNAAAWPWKPIP